MKFHEAMKLLDEGVCVRRSWWCKESFVEKGATNLISVDDRDFAHNYTPSTDDIFANDWEVYQEESTEESKGDELVMYLSTGGDPLGMEEVSIPVRVSMAELQAFARAVVRMYGESDEGE